MICPRCGRTLGSPTCQACSIAWSSPPEGTSGTPESPWAMGVAALLPLVFPPLVIVCWPVLSFFFARRLYLRHAAGQPDLFLKIILGVLLSAFAGVGAFGVVFSTCLGGVATWSGLSQLFR